MNLTGKTILLTGASGGIGAAMALALAQRGAKLILQGRDGAKLQSLLQALNAPNGGRHCALAGDLNQAAAREALVNYCNAVPGGIDILINNAGISTFAALEDTDDAQLQALLTTNLLAPMQLTRALLPLLHRRAEAAVVNVGSTFGSIGYAGFTGYCASKFGLRGFSEALRRELADSAISVFYLAPRATRTAINVPAVDALNEALGNATDNPERVAAALVELLESESRHRYIGWPEKFFAAINHLAPAVVDRALRKQLGVIKSFFNTADKRA